MDALFGPSNLGNFFHFGVNYSFKQQISIFLKDYVTVKTRVMAAEKIHFSITAINYI